MNETNGYIKLYRKLISWGWYKNHVVKDLFIHCLCRANFQDQPFEGMIIKRGQFVTSIKNLAEELGFTEQQIRTAIKKLSSTNEITSKSTNKFTVITVINWGKYQDGLQDVTNGFDEQTVNRNKKSQKSTNKITNKITNKKEPESLENSGTADGDEKILTNKITSTLTNEQQTNNKQITNKQQQYKNIKNDKNEKNDKNIIFIGDKSPKKTTSFSPPTVDDVKAYCTERKNGIDAEHFVDYYTANGWYVGKTKMKDWKAAVRTWEKTNNKNQTALESKNDTPIQKPKFQYGGLVVE